MTLHVLVGPSLAADKVRALVPNAEIHSPAEYGSIYQLIDSSCSQILLIDGLFFYNASVWHREIIAALDSGIEVFGCSSMGALRAAELSLYGMVGMGRVYDYYRSGLIDGDDEVAVLHGPEVYGYPSFTVPLVSLRWNLNLLKEKQLISDSDLETIVTLVKQVPFYDRSWLKIFDILKHEGQFSNERIGEFERLLTAIWQDVKELDAHDALINISTKGRTVLPATLKNDYPQPDYISHAINNKFANAYSMNQMNASKSSAQKFVLDLVCIMNYIAPLVVTPLNQNNLSFTPGLNFLSRKAESITVNMLCISSAILAMSGLSDSNIHVDKDFSANNTIIGIFVSLGYLSLISGMPIRGHLSEYVVLPLNKQYLYDMGRDIVKQGAISLGLESSRGDPAYAKAAYNLLMKS